MVYPINSVLGLAKKHCFYNDEIAYPPAFNLVGAIAKETAGDDQTEQLTSWPLLHKKTLYTTVQRLVNDTSPENTYRQSSYVSITGGGRGAQPLFFATDVNENRRQRAEFGKLIASTGMLNGRDWVVSMHSGGGLYRALDLTLEIIESAGACTLAAGSYMPLPEIQQLLVKYKANVLSGDSSQIINFVNHVSTLSPEERDQIHLDKIIYTSEVLTGPQRAHIRATLGHGVKICSLLASAETGPWALSNPDLTGERTTASSDFVYDTRTMAVEIFPDSVALEGDNDTDATTTTTTTTTAPMPLKDGETGAIVLTSLCRLRNPLVRYISGDVGSLHELPDHVKHLVAEADRPYIRVLRLDGRDRRFSFDWEGNYIEFGNLAAIVEDPRYGILQWQTILQSKPEGLVPCLELRVLPGAAMRDDEALQRDMVDRVKLLISLEAGDEDMFVVVYLENTDGFEKSKTGGKVVKFIDRLN
ncbi:uncharacterized protein BBA_02340 [Beauveria bassiana ARSEF 2860]|uniref:AMP-dependent synthetase/ligase domain-containing protein n=1 Tax=Beauveria bassiana (strain ARSEF 2860) TaxID=655819 RepID=J5JU87_BEAB2|nr:uncharacterized protein BBA_02340 [Beauveria bassiana ARSEF 2860]EJP68338.1 hypothetical protein BBA_02340 [Beauveria bassiana ARSEF 2860]